MKLKLSDKAKDVIKVVAPTLGTALGGPLGGLAGQILGGLVGGDTKKLEEALVTQAPETMLALRKAEQEFQIKLAELGVEEERIGMADRASARDMAKVDMRAQIALSTTFIGGYFVVFWMLISGSIELTSTQQTLVNVLLGVLTAGIPQILAFWFGSTAGSAVKSQLLAASKPVDTP